ncbi:MAG: DUF4065 domain-containing protein [Corynebacterium sp.]|nr:DUF4065 domain-containing protein [Corynebacterium sp.]
MANIRDVGQYIVELVPNVDKMKFYKLCYFSQGWSLAWTGRPLFDEPLEAWRKGPVPRTLWQSESYTFSQVAGGDSASLTARAREIIYRVVEFYKNYDSTKLSYMSHKKAWKEAREGVSDIARSQEILSLTTIREEFTDLLHSGAPVPVAPPHVFIPENFSVNTMLAAAEEVEQVWGGALSLLADR